MKLVAKLMAAALLILSIQTAFALKFAVIADPHVCNMAYEPGVKNTVKMFHYNKEIFENTIKRINGQDVGFVLVAGDLTKDSEPWNHETAIKILNGLKCPYYVVPGNHDVDKEWLKDKPHWTLRDFITHYHPWLFGGRSYYAVKITKNVLLIGLNTNDPEDELKNTWGGHVSEEQLKWLERVLKHAREKWIIILTHHCLLFHPTPWDKGGMNPNFRVSNYKEVLKVLEKYASKHHIVVFCGHLHTTDIAYWNGIYEVACPSLCTYPLAYRIVEIDGDVMKIRTVWYPNETLRKIALEEAIKTGWNEESIKVAEGMPWDRNVTLKFEKGVKNVILMIGDGMGFAQLHLTELTYGNLTMEHFNWTSTGFELTDSLSGEVTDSAAAGTALATGFKTYNGMISTITENGRLYDLTTLLEVAQKLGKSTGLVTTTRITHATPAVFASHVEDRDMEMDIARQLIEHRVNVLLGGGLKEFDDATLTLARNLGYEIVYNRTQLEGAEGSYILGLFAKSHIPYVLDRTEDVPSLPEMTEKALEILSENPKGFFVMVEGGRIDHACHANDAASTVAETLEFDKAVETALDFARLGHTVVVVTADHETGGLTLGVKYGRSIDFEKLKQIKRSISFMAELIKNGEDPAEVVEEYANITLTPEEVARIKNATGKYEPDNTLAEILCEHLGLKFATHKHSGVPVPLMIYGVKFEGFHHHVETSKLMAKLMLGKLTPKAEEVLAYVGNFSYVKPEFDLNHDGVIDYGDVLIALH